jgi:hypothetical protein
MPAQGPGAGAGSSVFAGDAVLAGVCIAIVGAGFDGFTPVSTQ